MLVAKALDMRRTNGQCALFRKGRSAALIRSAKTALYGACSVSGMLMPKRKSSSRTVSKYLLMWTPLQPGQGRPENAVMTNAIGRTSVTGPEATRDAHRQMFDRVMDHNAKKPLVARKALASISRDRHHESIAAENRKFWGGNK